MPLVAGATNRMDDLMGSILTATSPEKENTAQEQPTPEEVTDEAPADTADETTETTTDEQDVDNADEATDTGSGEDTVDDAGDQDEPAQETSLYTVTIDGKEEQVTLDEALAGYQRGKDYTRKTQEAAEIRKAAEEKQRLADAEAESYRAKRTEWETLLTEARKRLDGSEPTMEELQRLQRDDPQAYQAAVAEKVLRREQREAIAAEEARIAQEKQRETNAALQAHYAKEAKALFEKMPSWKDQEKHKADMDALRSYVRSSGVSDQEFATVSDHRVLLFAHKARLYDELMAKKPVVQKKIDAAPKMAPPGPRKPQKNQSQVEKQRAQEKFNRSGKVEDAVPLLMVAR